MTHNILKTKSHRSGDASHTSHDSYEIGKTKEKKIICVMTTDMHYQYQQEKKKQKRSRYNQIIYKKNILQLS